MEDTMIKNLEEKTGRKFSEWISIVKKSKLEKHGEIIKLLKEKHGLTHGYANLVAHKATGTDAGSAPGGGEDLVGKQYKGKENLRPWYDKAIAAIKKFGNDVEIAPKNAYVSIRRKKQFALIQPSTKTRLDIGINLKGEPAKGKLEASGSFNAMCSHRVRIEKEIDLNKDVIGWLKKAYDLAG
jgi:predicted transport protein